MNGKSSRAIGRRAALLAAVDAAAFASVVHILAVVTGCGDAEVDTGVECGVRVNVYLLALVVVVVVVVVSVPTPVPTPIHYYIDLFSCRIKSSQLEFPAIELPVLFTQQQQQQQQRHRFCPGPGQAKPTLGRLSHWTTRSCRTTRE
jgi:hypothetical protein